MTDKRIDETLELKNLENHNITMDEWLNYAISKNILNIRMELITIRKMIEEVHHTVILK